MLTRCVITLFAVWRIIMYTTYTLLLLSSLLHITTFTVYTVTPDDHYYPNTTCHHCHNLQHYLLNITKYFTSNTQLLFLPGLHHLHTDLIIQNVHNISLIGSTANGTTLDTVIIQCNSSVGIVMTNITNLTIKNIIIQELQNKKTVHISRILISYDIFVWSILIFHLLINVHHWNFHCVLIYKCYKIH